MQAYQIVSGAHVAGLERVERPAPVAGLHEVLVRTHAVSLNYRDLMFARGQYGPAADHPMIPVADGAGEVIAIGAGVTRFKPGDRVINTYFPDWIDGRPTPAKTRDSFGAQIDGVLAEQFVTHEDALVAIPAHLDYAEAATLSCAGITAWNAIFVEAALKPGDSVLLLGTGGVSIIALQLAKAAGLRAIVTSSSDDKLERARALGADAVINYRDTPEWQNEVLRLTDGIGVDAVVEVGGEGTLARSIQAARMGGTVAVIGGVTGFGGTQVDPLALITGVKRLAGIFVGSRAMLDALAKFVEVNRIVPVVDRVFDFGQAREAYEHLEASKHFGKVVVRVQG